MILKCFTTVGHVTNGIRIALFLGLFFSLSAQSKGQSLQVWKLKDLEAAVNQPATPVVINFWATFCKPCIDELPHFQKLASEYKSLNLNFVFVSLDLKEAFPKKILAFKKRVGLTSKVVWLDEFNADVFCPVVNPSWSGVIPATIFLNPQTGYRKFYEDELSAERLETEIKAMLKPKDQTAPSQKSIQ